MTTERRKYQLTREQEQQLLSTAPFERPDFWEALGVAMGFKPETVRNVPGEPSQFTAEDAEDIPQRDPTWNDTTWH
jgi:hypothetical protein